MSDDEVAEILEEIIELARLLGWSSALAQDKENAILGLYLGNARWIESKVGKSEKLTH